ncbi:hypothetical protein [Glaciecola sp. 1036]|uniref:hypothetical protein n=1 Tax=Alteromonadaceae TaxID=72275 RepID=UPI003D03C77C
MRSFFLFVSILITFQCGAQSWYKLDNPKVDLEISELELEIAIWTEINRMMVGVVPDRSVFTYHYQIKDENTVVIWGYCEVDESFESMDKSKQRLVVLDGGTCYFTAQYTVDLGSVKVVFNGVA